MELRSIKAYAADDEPWALVCGERTSFARQTIIRLAPLNL